MALGNTESMGRQKTVKIAAFRIYQRIRFTNCAIINLPKFKIQNYSHFKLTAFPFRIAGTHHSRSLHFKNFRGLENL